MSIHAFPVTLQSANAMRRVMREARPTSHFEIVGQRECRFVKETKSNGTVEMHGHEQRPHHVGKGWKRVR